MDECKPLSSGVAVFNDDFEVIAGLDDPDGSASAAAASATAVEMTAAANAAAAAAATAATAAQISTTYITGAAKASLRRRGHTGSWDGGSPAPLSAIAAAGGVDPSLYSSGVSRSPPPPPLSPTDSQDLLTLLLGDRSLGRSSADVAEAAATAVGAGAGASGVAAAAAGAGGGGAAESAAEEGGSAAAEGGGIDPMGEAAAADAFPNVFSKGRDDPTAAKGRHRRTQSHMPAGVTRSTQPQSQPEETAAGQAQAALPRVGTKVGW